MQIGAREMKVPRFYADPMSVPLLSLNFSLPGLAEGCAQGAGLSAEEKELVHSAKLCYYFPADKTGRDGNCQRSELLLNPDQRLSLFLARGEGEAEALKTSWEECYWHRGQPEIPAGLFTLFLNSPTGRRVRPEHSGTDPRPQCISYRLDADNHSQTRTEMLVTRTIAVFLGEGAVQAVEPPRLTPKGKAASLKPKRGRCPVHPVLLSLRSSLSNEMVRI
ncbi:PREDICTED: uncharacterized protein LOC109323978 [Crocodylus porosus]|uniref:uncharacterized protein LOC109323978 n=1 Tax=Crocodylus porosus TaxID=8502 RepID=UPI0009399102|nr:PREDICTED: uncharacterized protein LOC109323978 [Crocodylus porosus]